jgi:hypothetical protein
MRQAAKTPIGTSSAVTVPVTSMMQRQIIGVEVL